jgi:cell shape-determining protein MreC
VWKRGNADIAYVTSVPRHAHVQKHDIVETNGYSDIFPPGLPIGVVQHIGDSPDGMSYFLRTKLFANFSTLREVSVITNYSAPERRQLEEMATDPTRLDSVLNQQAPEKTVPEKIQTNKAPHTNNAAGESTTQQPSITTTQSSENF